ncbi:MAG: aspartate carbamoyltransferase catalytic subunit [Spirochaetia bacterium]|nr:aspartate carbamoyltransferase catalytic subunit [Spirochaetota bacterium]MCX8096353.1 aspartate carbamoyltransferase catalytic subunit [Spirochaetota bacterium]MDW8112286.1 aspartate carbamoyltransferase catalytic subunit [Spirochaetia bacterium]
MKHLLGIKDLSSEEIMSIIELGEVYRNELINDRDSIPQILRERVIVNLFFEPSTRTRMSFEMASSLLGAKVLNFSENVSSIQKGESRLDTLKTIEAMKVDAVVIRSNISGLPYLLARDIKNVSIINAGDGSHEHPSQALLDALTMKLKFGDIRRINLSIVGDILFSRVARSNILLMKKIGNNNLMVYGPTTLLPKEIEMFGVRIARSFDEVIEFSDVIMLLRIQTERQNSAYVPSTREYKKFWGLTEEKLKSSNKEVFVMHPGPVNREVEISSDVIYCDKSLILDQVTSGVAIRMSILSHIFDSKNQN